MDYIFLNTSGQTLFVRSDIEEGHFVHQEMSLTATFPLRKNKLIEKGQRVAFLDIVTDALEVFEIRNVQNFPTEGYQQITAEHICIADLQDEHINRIELTNKTAQEALTTALTGTLWSVGTNTASGSQNANFDRGSVWQAVCVVMQNWNVFITPRVVVNSAGVITGRYLDIAPAQGTWRGLRLSISKNLFDPCVTYDDSDVFTAMYGYGGMVDVPHTGQQDTSEELTFADTVWTATSEHPAKPAGQTYLEWPEKTAIYGRAGRARFGYYQNSQITDPAVLLQKTWETLKQAAEPKVTVSGTVTDLKRLGYNDIPVRLHDMALIEIEETGELIYKLVTCFDEDLVNPQQNRPEIGDYIPTIIYINRETSERAGGSGGHGGHGQTNIQHEDGETYSEFVKTQNMIGMVVGTYNGGYKIEAGRIILAINESNEAEAFIDADHINISATQTVRTLAGAMHIDTNGKLVIDNAGGMYVQRTESGVTSQFGVWDKGNLTGGVMVQNINGQNTLKLIANVIDIDGIVNALTSYNLTTETLHATNTLTIEGEATFSNGVTCTEGSGLDGGYVNVTDVDTTTLTVDGDEATWQTYQARKCSLSQQHYYCYAASNGSTQPVGTSTGRIVTAYTDETLHYLGKAST